MSSPITLTDFDTAHAITVPSTQTAAGRALFTPGATVYRLGDLPPLTGAATQVDLTSWMVVREEAVFVDNGSVTKYGDQSLAYATPADPSTTRAVPGFAHTTTPVATTSATPRSSRYFYVLQYIAGPLAAGQARTLYQQHEMQLNSKANIETYLAANIAAMI